MSVLLGLTIAWGSLALLAVIGMSLLLQGAALSGERRVRPAPAGNAGRTGSTDLAAHAPAGAATREAHLASASLPAQASDCDGITGRPLVG